MFFRGCKNTPFSVFSLFVSSYNCYEIVKIKLYFVFEIKTKIQKFQSPQTFWLQDCLDNFLGS